MDDEIRIPADRAGEMAVVALRQAIVADGLGGIGGALKALEQTELDDVLLGTALRVIQEFLDVGAIRQIPRTVAVSFSGLGVVEQPRWIGIIVNTVDRWFHTILEDLRDRLICGEHAFFHQLVALGVDHWLGHRGTALLVEPDLDFRHFEVERAIVKPPLPHGRGECPAFLDHADQRRI